jgi:uncharacterized RDD family membrane protein YckC
MEPLDTYAEVETPEHVRFRYLLAGPSRRALAYLIDTIVRGQILFVFMVLSGLGSMFHRVDRAFANASMGMVFLVVFLVDWGYFVLLESLWGGRSIGKRAMHIRVVTEGGHSLRFGDALLRNLLRAADFLPFGYVIGVLVMGRDARFRRLGDIVAGTMVVLDDKTEVADLIRVDPPPSPDERAWLPDRTGLTGDDLEAIELFLRRGHRLSPTRQRELAELIAPLYAKRLGVRYHDPARFLALLYCRAREKRGAA